jgi:3-deoxy-D-manno-octulosonic-acid transferase
MIRVYRALLCLATPVILARLALRGFRSPEYWRRWGERFGRVPADAGPADVWLHAVSVGEARAALPLVDALRRPPYGLRLLVTTTTPTGSAQVRDALGGEVGHCYAPYDLPGAVSRFLDAVRPRAALVMETELWPNQILECARRGIPMVFVNARLSQRSFERYTHYLPSLMADVLPKAAGFAAQSAEDAERLGGLGAPAEKLRITGNIKFDAKVPASLTEVGRVLRRQLGAQRPVWIAGSTREGEEALVLDAFRAVREQLADALLVVAPRHPERFGVVARQCRSAGFAVALRSDHKGPVPPEVSVYVCDTMGELTQFYAAGDVAFVGGSLVPTGGHNLLEPLSLGVPVLFGPHTEHFAEISRLVLERGAGRRVGNPETLAASVMHLLTDANARFAMGEAGLRLITENRGALDRTLAFLDQLVPSLRSRD